MRQGSPPNRVSDAPLNSFLYFFFLGAVKNKKGTCPTTEGRHQKTARRREPCVVRTTVRMHDTTELNTSLQTTLYAKTQHARRAGKNPSGFPVVKLLQNNAANGTASSSSRLPSSSPLPPSSSPRLPPSSSPSSPSCEPPPPPPLHAVPGSIYRLR